MQTIRITSSHSFLALTLFLLSSSQGAAEGTPECDYLTSSTSCMQTCPSEKRLCAVIHGELGDSVPERADILQAVHLVQASADLRCGTEPSTCYIIAELFGLLGEKAKAAEYQKRGEASTRGLDSRWETECSQGNLEKCQQVARRINAKEPERAMALLKPGCDANDLPSCELLALIVISTDPSRALSIWERICALGSAAGCSRAGFVHSGLPHVSIRLQRGQTWAVKRDLERGRTFLGKACELHTATANKRAPDEPACKALKSLPRPPDEAISLQRSNKPDAPAEAPIILKPENVEMSVPWHRAASRFRELGRSPTTCDTETARVAVRSAVAGDNRSFDTRCIARCLSEGGEICALSAIWLSASAEKDLQVVQYQDDAISMALHGCMSGFAYSCTVAAALWDEQIDNTTREFLRSFSFMAVKPFATRSIGAKIMLTRALLLGDETALPALCLRVEGKAAVIPDDCTKFGRCLAVKKPSNAHAVAEAMNTCAGASNGAPPPDFASLASSAVTIPSSSQSLEEQPDAATFFRMSGEAGVGRVLSERWQLPAVLPLRCQNDPAACCHDATNPLNREQCTSDMMCAAGSLCIGDYIDCLADVSVCGVVDGKMPDVVSSKRQGFCFASWEAHEWLATRGSDRSNTTCLSACLQGRSDACVPAVNAISAGINLGIADVAASRLAIRAGTGACHAGDATSCASAALIAAGHASGDTDGFLQFADFLDLPKDSRALGFLAAINGSREFQSAVCRAMSSRAVMPISPATSIQDLRDFFNTARAEQSECSSLFRCMNGAPANPSILEECISNWAQAPARWRSTELDEQLRRSAFDSIFASLPGYEQGLGRK